MRKKIIFTGGGTAGHVTPNIPLIESFAQLDWDVVYIGSKKGIEKTIIERQGVPFRAVSNGKLRRYFSWENFIDPFKILLGIFQAYWILRREKANVVFSKGGFVAFPVVVGAWLNRIPVIAHESDITPGLANRLCFPFVKTVCLNFSASTNHFKNHKNIKVTGTPLREQLFHGDKLKALERCRFTSQKSCILVIGGSQGANALNACVRTLLNALLKQYQIIHLCGKGKLDSKLAQREGYFQTEYANEELADYFAASDLVISRAGANALYELLALNKPHILVPLSQKASRGDQIHNARYFEEKGVSLVIQEEQLNPELLIASIEDVMNKKEFVTKQISALNIHSGTKDIVKVIQETARV